MNNCVFLSSYFNIDSCWLPLSLLQDGMVETGSVVMAGLAETEQDPKIDRDSKDEAAAIKVPD